jgi:hypothetical protein
MKNQDTDTQSEPDDILSRWDKWYGAGTPVPFAEITRAELLAYRSQAHHWLTELREYQDQARPDQALCVCNAIQAAIEEFQWSQKLLNTPAFSS